MKKIIPSCWFVLILISFQSGGSLMAATKATTIKLPNPALSGEVSIEAALEKRKSVRSYRTDHLPLGMVSQLLWAAQGITREGVYRTAPSAGALYPLETYLVAGQVTDLKPGVYRYHPKSHELELVSDGDVRAAIAQAAYGQRWFSGAPACVVLSAVYRRVTGKYGERGTRYADMEAGHAAQNFALQATALELGTVAVGAFEDDRVRKIMGMPGDETPLYILPVGYPASE